MTKTPPNGFVRSLALVDPLLRVRWGGVVGQWVIDREAYIPVTEREFLARRLTRARYLAHLDNADPKHIQTFKGLAEEHLSARDGRRVIFFSERLDDKTFNAICASDIKRYGGYSRFADALEEQEAAAERAKQRRQANLREDVNGEAWEQLKFLFNRRQAKLGHGIRDLKELLR